jgi:hypothetical protein
VYWVNVDPEGEQERRLPQTSRIVGAARIARFVGTLATSSSFASRLTALRRLLAMRMCPLRATASTGMCIRKHASGQTTKQSSQVYVLIRNAAATRRQCAWIDENESSRTRRTRLRLCAVGSEEPVEDEPRHC